MELYWINFCNEERPILTMAGFFVSQAKRRGWTTSSVDAKTEGEERDGRKKGEGGEYSVPHYCKLYDQLSNICKLQRTTSRF